MSVKETRYYLFGGIVLLLSITCFLGGIIVGWVIPAPKVIALPFKLPFLESTSATAAQEAASIKDTTELFKPFWETWDLVHDQFFKQPVDNEVLMRGAIRGMLEALDDPYTSYMDPAEYTQMDINLGGDYDGIGAWVDTTGEYLSIISPMPGSPAEEAGLKPNDKVIGIDGEDMTGIDGEIVLSRILGKAGTKVILTIQRDSVTKPFDVEITRAKITVPSVSGKMLEDENIAYVQLLNFGEDTADDLKHTLNDLQKNKPDGLILDLRYNGGGYVNSAVDVVAQFIGPEKVVTYEQYGSGNRRTETTGKGGVAIEIPLVVLVNEGSASASEITAGAIQDYQRGTLVGVTTFGKGKVQNVIPLINSAGAVRITIANWLTPNERMIDEIGLQPDVEVEITDKDIEAKRDVQLEKAIEILKKNQ